MAKVCILNDCSKTGHAGCELTIKAIEAQCERVGLEVIYKVPINADLSNLDPILRKADLLIVNGEGSIHHGNHPELVNIADKYPSVLINCVFQQNGNMPGLAGFRMIRARETASALELVNSGAPPDRVAMVPDMVFSIVEPVQTSKTGYGVLILDSQLEKGYGIQPYMPAVDYVKTINQYDCVVSGRLHGCVIAACLDIPFAAYDGNTHKIAAMMNDMGMGEFYAQRYDLAYLKIRKCNMNFEKYPRERVRAYVDMARRRIEEMFDKIARIANG
jgi:hypothetical protein